MALIQADRVRETSSTTGSAGFTLVGAVDGFQRFSAAIGSANTCYYAATDGSAFEVGLGTVSANVLARTTVFDSSHTSSGTVHRVNFQSGTKDVFATYVADKAVILDADGNLTVGTTADISTLGNASVAKTLTITSGISGASTLNVKGAVSAGSTLGVKGNVSSEGTLSVIGAVSVGATLGITNDASVTGTFTFATATSSGSLDILKNASVGGTFHIEGNASAQGTLNVKGAVSVASTLGVEGDIDNESGNLTINPATQIVEVKGDGSSVEGQIQLNCHANTHGQRVRAQPHSEGITNTMLLPQGASSTLVSQVGTATLTNKTYLDVDGNLRSVPNSRVFGAGVTDAATASALDNGNFILFAGTAASVQNFTLPATFTAGAVFTLVNTPFGGKTAASTTTISAAGTAFIAGGESATAVISLGFNGVATVLYVTAGGCFITGNVS